MIIPGMVVGLIMAVGAYLGVAVVWYAITAHSARYNLHWASKFDRARHLRRAERQAAAWYWPVYLVMAMVHAIADSRAEIGDIAGQRTPLHAEERRQQIKQLEAEVDRLRRQQAEDR